MLAASTSQTNMLVKRDEFPLNDASPVMRAPISGYIEINKKGNSSMSLFFHCAKEGVFNGRFRSSLQLLTMTPSLSSTL
ncbi:hypothetical protein VNO80_10302 [Phaseolus coccineus]|uniref:Uncharacterized protein n=1 Tax=Phaseolus coccineus TaxID=3886 RepID=A0AAN9N8B6_PHACN